MSNKTWPLDTKIIQLKNLAKKAFENQITLDVDVKAFEKCAREIFEMGLEDGQLMAAKIRSGQFEDVNGNPVDINGNPIRELPQMTIITNTSRNFDDESQTYVDKDGRGRWHRSNE